MARVSAQPRADRTVKLSDGRSLAFAEWGDLEGRPVFLFHGRPGSRLLCPDEDATKAAGVRLVTVDRPGYGRSDPRPGRTLLDWGGDVEELADQLGIDQVGIPSRVTVVGLAAAPGPCDKVPGAWDAQPEEVRTLTELLWNDDPAALEGIRKRVQWFADDPESLFIPGWAGPDDPDAVLLADPEILEAMQEWMREAARQGTAGFVEDWIAEQQRWGFEPSDIEHDVHVWWGERDALVSRADTDYLSSVLPKA